MVLVFVVAEDLGCRVPAEGTSNLVADPMAATTTVLELREMTVIVGTERVVDMARVPSIEAAWRT